MTESFLSQVAFSPALRDSNYWLLSAFESLSGRVDSIANAICTYNPILTGTAIPYSQVQQPHNNPILAGITPYSQVLHLYTVPYSQVFRRTYGILEMSTQNCPGIQK